MSNPVRPERALAQYSDERAQRKQPDNTYTERLQAILDAHKKTSQEKASSLVDEAFDEAPLAPKTNIFSSPDANKA
ncbi:MAG: hypothetical protein KFB95_08405 [Simkaniaceae bacterium]|nr:MAG: hypothetical protein KFB95_08405 [Simkaniaceae bacterium]